MKSALSKAEAVEQVRRAYLAFRALREVREFGVPVGGGSVPWSVPQLGRGRRRLGRLPHDEEPSWDDVVRLAER